MTEKTNRSNALALNSSYDITQILIRIIYQYNHKRSTSIAIADAKQFVKSINYVIAHNQLTEQSNNVEMLYQDGLANLESEYDRLQTAFIKMKNDIINFNNIKYLDIMTTQFTAFFATYDLTYKAHICAYDLDYPLIDGMPLDYNMYDLNGLDLVGEYFKRLSMEHQFIRLFSKETITDFLKTYQQQKLIPVECLGLNLCEIIVIQYMFYLLIHNGYGLCINKQEYSKIIKKIKDYQTIDNVLKQCQLLLKKQLPDENVYRYILKVLPFFKAQFNVAYQNNTFDQLIIVKKDITPIKLAFKDNEMLSNNDFINLIQQLDATPSIESRAALIKHTKLSMIDLIDLLNELFWTDDEYLVFFNSLDLMTIAILTYTLFKNELYFTKLSNIQTLFDSIDYDWEKALIRSINNLDADNLTKLNLIIEQFGSFC